MHHKANVALSQLVIVDVQTKLAAVMVESDMQAVVKNCGILLQAANMLNVSAIITEQYPQGLGHTVPELAALSTHIHAVEKVSFSCLAEPKFSRH